MADPAQESATREDINNLGRQIQEHIYRRDLERNELGNERHRENVAQMKMHTEQLARIEVKVDRTNGRVTKLETLFNRIDQDFQGIRKRWHDFRDSIQLKVQNNQGQAGPQGAQGVQGLQGMTGENRNLTMRDFNIAFASISLGFAMFYAFAKLMKWLP